LCIRNASAGFTSPHFLQGLADNIGARDLLAEDDGRSAGVDKSKPRWPQMSVIPCSLSFACRAERLAWAGTRPYWSSIWPSSAPERVGPDANSCEEVALSKPGKLGWNDIANIPLVHHAWRDRSALDQIAQPLRRVRIVLVIPSAHATTPTACLTTCSGKPAITIALAIRSRRRRIGAMLSTRTAITDDFRLL